MNRIITQTRAEFSSVLTTKRVAAYARVSSGKDAMLSSLANQISYYSKIIRNNPAWQFIGVYSDEAVSGTKVERAQFQQMMADCRMGKIDMIMTKSVSRFARNTLTTLVSIRELSALGIDVYFEQENIHTLSGGEFILSILAAVAEAESISVSENCKWRIRKRFEAGEIVNLRFMYGYKISKEHFEIDPDQANIVRMIFSDYIQGKGCDRIAKDLRKAGVPPMRNGQWTAKRVADILKNEKYSGSCLLQKKYRKDYLKRKLVINKGEHKQYFGYESHPPIVSLDEFKCAQEIMARRRAKTNVKKPTTNRYPFSGKILCSCCGKTYKRVTNHGRIIWACSTMRKYGATACSNKPVPDKILTNKVMTILGLQQLDSSHFDNYIERIEVVKSGMFVIQLQQGKVLEVPWEYEHKRKIS